MADKALTTGSGWSRLEWKKAPDDGTSTYAGGRYCGPGWGFTSADVKSGRVSSLPDAVDAIDNACKWHDQCYEDNGYFTQTCNLELASKLTVVVVSSESNGQQRFDALVMAALFAVEAVVFDPYAKPLSGWYSYTKSRIEAMMLDANRSLESIINEMIQQQLCVQNLACR